MERFSLSNKTDKNKVFLVNQSNLEGRFDSYFYKYDFQLMIESLNNSKYETVPFKKIIKSINNGFDFRDYKDDGIPYIKVANVKQGEFDFSKIQYIDFSSDEITKNIQLKRGNILLTRKGTYGNALSLDKDYDYVISSEVFYIELKTDLIDSKYLEIFFNSNIGQKQFNRVSIGAIMGSLSQEALKTLKVPLPPKDIQQKIINLYQNAYSQKQQKETKAKELLASIDTYLLNELGITLPEKDSSLQSRIFSTMFNEVSGDRFDPDYNQIFYTSFIKKLSNKFESKKLNNITDSIFQGVGRELTENSQITLLKVKNIKKGNIIDFEDVEFVKSTPPNKILQNNDIISPFIGEAIKQIKFSIFNNPKTKCTVDNNTGVIRINQSINSNYVAEILNSKIGEIQVLKLIGGGGVPFLGSNSVSKIEIPLPPKEKQDEMAAHIQNIRAQAKQLQEEAKMILEEAKREVEKMII